MGAFERAIQEVYEVIQYIPSQFRDGKRNTGIMDTCGRSESESIRPPSRQHSTRDKEKPVACC